MGLGVALPREDMLQSGEHEKNIARLTRVSHQTDAPYLPLKLAQPATDLDVVFLIELALNLRRVDVFRHDNSGQRVQAIAWSGEQLEFECLQTCPQSRRGLRVSLPALTQSLFHDQT